MMQKTIPFICAALTAAAILAGCGGAEQRLARSIERGQEFLADGNYEKARVEFSNALQIDPNNADVVYLAGTVSERLGDYRAAARAYQAALDIDETHSLARAAMGRLYLFSGLPEQALEYAETGLESAPEHADLLTLRAAANAARGDNPLALSDAERVVQQHPDHEQAVALLAGLYESAGSTDRAILLIERALELRPASVDLRTVSAQLHQESGDLDRAESELKEAVALDPESPLPRQRLAQFYLSLQRDGDAERVLRELIDVTPDAIEPKMALVNFKLARTSFEAAETELRSLIASYPEDWELKIALGELYQTGERVEDAKAHFGGMVEQYGIEPAGLRARTRLAALLLESGAADEASDAVDVVLEENPRDNDALVLRANIAVTRGDPLTAITDLRSVLRDQPENSAVRAALARALAQNGDVGLARDEYRTAVSYDPANARLRIEFADFLGRRGENAEAEELLTTLLSSNPQDLAAIETLFKVRLASGDFESARQSAMRAIEYFPGHPLGYYLLGQVYEYSGESIELAINYYEQSLEREPRGAEPLGALARVLLKKGDRAAAKERIARAVAEFPDHVVALNLLAELHLTDRELEAATERADEAIAAAPAWWIPYRTKALARGGLGDVEGSRAAYAQGLAATGGAPALGMDLAALHERMNDPDAAIEVYEELVGANPSSEVLANNLAMLLTTYRADAGSIDRAANLVQRFRNSDVPAYLNTYGWVRFKQGNLDEAVSYLTRAASASPESPVMRYHLGMALLERGDVDRARSELSAAVATEQPFHGRDEAVQKLAELDRPRG